LEGTEVPWYVAAGWAIDLYLGGDHREHEDLEIAVPNDCLDEIVGAFPELEFCVITGPQEATPSRMRATGSTTRTRRGRASLRAGSGASTSSASPRSATLGSAAATRRSGCPTSG
jgi:Aminoglycoside-2''-adenylyltransferase